MKPADIREDATRAAVRVPRSSRALTARAEIARSRGKQPYRLFTSVDPRCAYMAPITRTRHSPTERSSDRSRARRAVLAHHEGHPASPRMHSSGALSARTPLKRGVPQLALRSLKIDHFDERWRGPEAFWEKGAGTSLAVGSARRSRSSVRARSARCALVNPVPTRPRRRTAAPLARQGAAPETFPRPSGCSRRPRPPLPIRRKAAGRALIEKRTAARAPTDLTRTVGGPAV